MLTKYFSIIRNYVLSVFSQTECTFYSQKHASRANSLYIIDNYEEDSLDDDSFVSQSRFGAYATCTILALTHLRSRQKHQATTELLFHGFQDKSSRSRSQYIHSKEIEILFDVYSVLPSQKFNLRSELNEI